MKMSRSIKDYKDAMDSIRISESFYKRTETLLNELPEEEIEKRPFYMSRKITAGVMAAAACLICVIGVRTVIGVRQDNIESTSENTLTEIEMEAETSAVSVPELIDILDDENVIDDMLIDDDIAVSEEEDYDEAAVVIAEPLTSDGGEGNAVAAVPDNPAPASGNSSEAGNTVPDKAESSSGSIEEKGGAGNSSPTSGGTGTVPETIASVTSGKTEADIEDAEDIEEDISESQAEDSSESAHDTTANDTVMLNDVSYEYVTVEITPYFDMDGIVSGESSVKLDGTDCRELIEHIGELSEKSYKIPNGSFKSLFSLSIADENIGITFYSIYLTNKNTMIITKHEPDGQYRVAYGLTGKEFNELKHTLFLMFGTESDYELFENLMSGK